MASKAANKRLTREYKAISENPPPYITAHPSESNILEWHYIITGPEDTPSELSVCAARHSNAHSFRPIPTIDATMPVHLRLSP
jgi:hypothetical protein